MAPSGRLPITFYRSVNDLPPFTDYRMAGRTYRYFEGKPLYPFGHGLGYTTIGYSGLSVDVLTGTPAERTVMSAAEADAVVIATVHAVAENRANRSTDNVVEVYATPRPRLPGDPLRSLVAFRRQTLSPGQKSAVEIELPARAFSRVDSAGVRHLVPGAWDLDLGGASVTVQVPELGRPSHL